jgi:hypothetical protein
MPDIDDPPRSQVTIVGQVSSFVFNVSQKLSKLKRSSFSQSTERTSDRSFYFEITQYFLKQQACTASFHCHFPDGNVRFDRVGVPRPKTLTIVIGFIASSSSPITATCNVKRIPMEVGEIQYLTTPSSAVGTGPKGVFLLSFPKFMFMLLFSAEPTSRFRKRGDRYNVEPGPVASTSNIQVPKTEDNFASDDHPLHRSIPDPSETLSEMSEHNSQIPPSKKKKTK